jgi:hypothetical protein
MSAERAHVSLVVKNAKNESGQKMKSVPDHFERSAQQKTDM